MADPIAWGLEIINGQKTDKVQDTLDGLDFETPLENGLNEIQSALNTAITQIKEQVDGMEETINNAPIGGPLPFALDDDNFKAESVSEGIKLTYKATMNLDNASTDNNLCGTIAPYGIMIRYATDHYPRTPKDGLLAVDDTDIVDTSAKMVMGTSYGKQKSYTLVGLTSNQTYYLSAFPYSYYGMYNINSGMDGNTVVRANSQRTTCTWTGTAATLTVTITQDLDVLELGEIIATLTPTAGGDALTQSRTGAGDIVFSGVTAGQYTLSFSTPSYFTAPASQEITLTAGQPNTATAQYTLKTGLSNYTWSEVISVADAGVAPQVFSVGETKDLQAGSETLTMKIYGFNHDDLTSGGKAPITFGTSHLMANTRQMNSSNTNVGSFVGSAMYAYLRDTVLPNLPEEIRTHIKTVNKKTSAGNQSASVQTDAMQIFLFSVNEVAGAQASSWVSNSEGSKYPVFSNDASRVKKLSNGAGAAQWWWLRSPRLNSSNIFYGVNSDGGVDYGSGYASISVGVCFGFCI